MLAPFLKNFSRESKENFFYILECRVLPLCLSITMVKTFRKSTGKTAMEKHLFDTIELFAMSLVLVSFHKI